ncbi:hypothetical protein LY632_08395 [Erythrobacter sp. SDW2]|uniref:TadE/TadG family type IV pilus assembly protein n=1 Tax=Erythrobacter sp. SDW2 TaxID=2907154 RepID=UPI001F3CAE1E|nr:hypothetical protein [Erythrobacter sp. SDW2]UIP05729.1 hypothetical protein LY632_08395 [Erythrobacter sp. SDW2]
MSRFAHFAKDVMAATSGVAMTEFALAAPLLMVAGLYGAETTWLSIVHMRVNQMALRIADDASRVGEISALETRKIYESDVNDLLYGSHLETDSLEFYANGRVIISSLEVVPESDPEQQYIHWQRCKGRLNWASTYGVEGDGLSGSFEGMGPVGSKVTAEPEDAIMFVEVAYNYQPLFGDMFVSDRLITAHAAFNVRDNRDLAELYQRDPLKPDPTANCSIFDDFDGNSTPVEPIGAVSPGGTSGPLLGDHPGTSGSSGTSSGGGSSSSGSSGSSGGGGVDDDDEGEDEDADD